MLEQERLEKESLDAGKNAEDASTTKSDDIVLKIMTVAAYGYMAVIAVAVLCVMIGFTL